MTTEEILIKNKELRKLNINLKKSNKELRQVLKEL